MAGLSVKTFIISHPLATILIGASVSMGIYLLLKEKEPTKADNCTKTDDEQ